MVHDHGSHMDARRIQAQTAYSSESICTGDFMLCDDHARSDPGTFYADLIQQGRYKKPYFFTLAVRHLVTFDLSGSSSDWHC